VQPDPSSSSLPETVGAAIDDATAALDALAALGEEIEDEWQYVQDLSGAWLARLGDVTAARGSEVLPRDAAAAVARLSDETGLITDPHRAIDWLSTFPQAILVALGERP
jgi:hypothetical protein